MNLMCIDQVALSCQKCGDYTVFGTILGVDTGISANDIFEHIFDENVGLNADEDDLDKFGGNCDEGYLDDSNQEFICHACLVKALKKKKARQKSRKASKKR